MMFKVGGWLAAAMLSCAACAPTVESKDSELDPNAAGYVLKSLPKDVAQRVLIDFGGKVHLVGYEVSPADVARPGSRVKLKLYWLSVAPLDEGWAPVTQILADDRVIDVPASSVLRQNAALDVSRWRRGMIYLDEQDVQLPRDIQASEVTLSVGFRRAAPSADDATQALPESGKPAPDAAAKPADVRAGEAFRPDLRLPILSGPSDAHERGLVATLSTGVTGERGPRVLATKTGAGRLRRELPKAASSARQQ